MFDCQIYLILLALCVAFIAAGHLPLPHPWNTIVAALGLVRGLFAAITPLVC